MHVALSPRFLTISAERFVITRPVYCRRRYSGPAYKFIIKDESAPSNFPLQPFRLLCPLCSGLPAKSQLVRTTMPKAAKKTTEKKVKAKKGPSAYNLFMKSELAKIKKADPKLDHKEAFKKAAANWSKSKK